ncbi:hypothetical protein ONS95_007062 [Cadophora gregata]|uniref:uncharacterized protein n=1 Tax=Cadophora gregata TaxID=51156 RepID=UPI0026DD5D4A|nr:uncharacterized protein ONS95_007062 [Cadophora gregata]KAK0100607.1 hypothetical protein ONS95_007062 [Cadophora gregata]KAK0117398.1 hypothetical protein ONS96_013228 [Cadophora gregata f. sp. sojae]
MSQTQEHEYKYDCTPARPLPVPVPAPPLASGKFDTGHEDEGYGYGYGIGSKDIPLENRKMGKWYGPSLRGELPPPPLPLQREQDQGNQGTNFRLEAVPRVSSTSTLSPRHTSETVSTGTSGLESTFTSTAANSTNSSTSTPRLKGVRMGRRRKGSHGDEEEGGEAGQGGDGNGSEQVHEEYHTDHGPIVRDIIIGGADGLTVPFALTAGLSSLGSTKLVIIGGLAELFSGAISMGLGAYLAAVTERDHYLCEEQRERDEVRNMPEQEKEECYVVLERYGVARETLGPVVDALARSEERWVQFMMDFELRLEKPNVSRAWISGATMGLSYFVGGLIPMIPYFIMSNVTHALFVSIAVTIVVLILFGFAKNYIMMRTTRAGFYGAAQTLVIGVLAAGTSYGIVRAIDEKGGRIGVV